MKTNKQNLSQLQPNENKQTKLVSPLAPALGQCRLQGWWPCGETGEQQRKPPRVTSTLKWQRNWSSHVTSRHVTWCCDHSRSRGFGHVTSLGAITTHVVEELVKLVPRSSQLRVPRRGSTQAGASVWGYSRSAGRELSGVHKYLVQVINAHRTRVQRILIYSQIICAQFVNRFVTNLFVDIQVTNIFLFLFATISFHEYYSYLQIL